MLLPSDKERKYYYLGLLGCPPLVGRSNAGTAKWQLRVEDEHTVKKNCGRVGQHPIVEKCKTTSLFKEIIHLLNTSLPGWTCIDILRIGESASDLPRDENPVIVWVGVVPGSTSSRLGVHVAQRCHAILKSSELDDVHCEVCEAVVEMCARPPTIKNLGLSVDDITGSGAQFPAFGDSIGQSVAMEANPTREASLGCYVSLAKERNTPTEKYAIISRHLVFPDDDNTVYCYRNSAPKKYVIMPGNHTLDEAKKNATMVLKAWTECLAHVQHNASLRQTHSIESVEKHVINMTKLSTFLASLSNVESRRIGYVEYSPARRVHATTGNAPDFALVKLTQDRFSAALQNLVDFVHIAGELNRMSEINNNLIWDTYDVKCDNLLLRLKGVVPAAEIIEPAADLTPPWGGHGKWTITGDTVLRVGKRGSRTGLTWGEVNELESVTRTEVNGQKIISRHLTIFALGGKRGGFSNNGDSGSAIFTPHEKKVGMPDGGTTNENKVGTMVGMLDGGRRPGEEDPRTGAGVLTWDITYGTPLGWILDHIHDAGYATAHFS